MYLYSRGRKEEARKIFKELGTKTNCEIDDHLLEKVEADILKKDDDENRVDQYTILDLFRHKDLALASANIGFAYMVNSMVFYGLTFNLVSYAGSIYINNTINGIVGLVGYVLVQSSKFAELSRLVLSVRVSFFRRPLSSASSDFLKGQSAQLSSSQLSQNFTKLSKLELKLFQKNPPKFTTLFWLPLRSTNSDED